MRIVRICSVFVLLLSFACKSEKTSDTIADVKIFNVANEDDRKEFSVLKLDDTHVNLLNPTISKDGFEAIYKSWSQFHYDLNDFLTSKNFTWGVDDENIKLFNRIYFTKEGKVKAYAYRVYNQVGKEKTEEYGKVIGDFLKSKQISLTRDVAFAQCGKMSLPNSIKRQEL
ncbi:hypothetical protein [Pseudotenacibaculum haliotis]|uniref:Lipoprotein n=1 Tax=Pseudotenacibaculum haliotis TaxID=1862138 RepID=A0ABW5LQY3_9FLAO